MSGTSDIEGAGGQGRPRIKGWWRPIVLVAVVLVVWTVAYSCRADKELADLRDWIAALGAIAPIAFIILRAGAAVAVIPGSPVTATAAALFSPVTAIVCVSAGKTLGACVSFLIARYFARDAVAQWLATKPKVHRFDALVASHGALVVALMRLVPAVPFSWQNYGFGLTPIRFATYLFWSWLCMLPGAIFVVSGANVIIETSMSGRIPWEQLIIFVASAAVMAGFALYCLLKLHAGWRESDSGTDEQSANGKTG